MICFVVILWGMTQLIYAEEHLGEGVKRPRAIETRVAGSQDLEPFYQEAKKRGLPTRFFDELKQRKAWIVVKSTSGGAQYRPGLISGGTIYIKSVDTPLPRWTAIDFSNFYNELFHAWWANVFLKDEKYSQDRRKLFEDEKLKRKYDRAFPGDPKRAQEEGYSETVASLIVLAAGKRYFDPHLGKLVSKQGDLSQLYYRKHYSAAPVSHSDVRGYTPEAEDIYLDEEEYGWLFEKLFNQKAPKSS